MKDISKSQAPYYQGMQEGAPCALKMRRPSLELAVTSRGLMHSVTRAAVCACLTVASLGVFVPQAAAKKKQTFQTAAVVVANVAPIVVIPTPAPPPVAPPAPAPADATAPSTPAQFSVFEDYCGDVFVAWYESTDDSDAPDAISYEVHVNGALKKVVQGQGWAAFNLTQLGPVEFSVIAVDSAGNASAPASTTVYLEGC